MTVPEPSGRGYHPEPVQLGRETLATIQPVAFSATTILFHAGDIDDQLYVILSGEIELIDGLNTDHERLASVRGADELLGEMSVFQAGRQHRFSGRVRRDVQVLILQRSEMDAILRREPLLAYELLRVANSHLHRSHHRATRILEEKNQELAEAYAALERAQAQLMIHERLQHELRLAREIQERMLPATLPHSPTIDLGARIIPAQEVGGDFYDAFAVDDETLGLVIGDVCGKGMPAALYMAQVRSLIRAAAASFTPPDMVLDLVNTALRMLNSGDMFVTVVYAIFHSPTRTLTLARAGHEYPLLRTSAGLHIVGVAGAGQPLGMLANPVLDVQIRVLEPNDMLVLYTDGIPDAQELGTSFFGQERLQTIVANSLILNADAMCQQIVQAVAVFQGHTPQTDDITLLTMHVIA
jgi:serine phosphatase RsbU (regulator of sigma subunit)